MAIILPYQWGHAGNILSSQQPNITARQHANQDRLRRLELAQNIEQHLRILGMILELDINVLVVLGQRCQALAYNHNKTRQQMNASFTHTCE